MGHRSIDQKYKYYPAQHYSVADWRIEHPNAGANYRLGDKPKKQASCRQTKEEEKGVYPPAS